MRCGGSWWRRLTHQGLKQDGPVERLMPTLPNPNRGLKINVMSPEPMAESATPPRPRTYGTTKVVGNNRSHRRSPIIAALGRCDRRPDRQSRKAVARTALVWVRGSCIGLVLRARRSLSSAGLDPSDGVRQERRQLPATDGDGPPQVRMGRPSRCRRRRRRGARIRCRR